MRHSKYKKYLNAVWQVSNLRKDDIKDVRCDEWGDSGRTFQTIPMHNEEFNLFFF